MTTTARQQRAESESGRGMAGAVAGRRKPSRRQVVWLVSMVLVGLFYIEPLWLISEELSTDAAAYFSHAATLALDLDLDYANEPTILVTLDGRGGGPIGSGVMAAPFVGALSMLDRVRGHPVVEDHRAFRFSWSLFGFQLSTLFFFLVGVWLYWRAGRLIVPGLDPRLNFLFAFSTGVPFYVLRRFAMTHAFEYAALALGFWAAVRLYDALKRDEAMRLWIGLAGLAVLVSLAVRMNNLNTVGLPAITLVLLYAFDTAPDRPGGRRLWTAFGTVLGVTALALVPIALFNLYFYGAVYPSALEMYGFDMRGLGAVSGMDKLRIVVGRVPYLAPLLFGSELGVLYTNPIVVVGGLYLVGRGAYVLAVRRDPATLLAVLGGIAYFGFNFAIVLWWRTTGSSYGYRYLFPLIPLGLAGVLLAMRQLSTVDGAPPRPSLRRAFLVALIALCSVSVASQFFFGTRDELSARPQVNAFGRFHSASANGYMTALPARIVEPFTWVSMAARRYIGLAVGPVMMETPLRAVVPAGFGDRYRRVYGDLPPDVFVQMFILFALWVVGSCAVVYEPRRPLADGRSAAPTTPTRAGQVPSMGET